MKPQKPETKCLSLNLNSQDRYPHEELAWLFDQRQTFQMLWVFELVILCISILSSAESTPFCRFLQALAFASFVSAKGGRSTGPFQHIFQRIFWHVDNSFRWSKISNSEASKISKALWKDARQQLLSSEKAGSTNDQCDPKGIFPYSRIELVAAFAFQWNSYFSFTDAL